MNEIVINLGELQNSCFVVMPFDPLYQTEYEKIIAPALDDLKIKCVRGDEIYSKQRIMDDIWASIRKCRFVIAELTGRNPNVLYEVGLAHAIGKPVIILTRNSDDVPFDLKDLRYLYYDTSDPFWGENLRMALKDIVSKVLENPNIETYLEGISKSPSKEFPKLSNKKPIKKGQKQINISGTWIGRFLVSGEHDIVIEIKQDETTLFASAVITYSLGNDHSVIQETMSGSIEKEKIFLTGVNYTYIRRGQSNNYYMDTFELIINDTFDALIGTVIDGDKKTGTISLNKNIISKD